MQTVYGTYCVDSLNAQLMIDIVGTYKKKSINEV